MLKCQWPTGEGQVCGEAQHVDLMHKVSFEGIPRPEPVGEAEQIAVVAICSAHRAEAEGMGFVGVPAR